MVAIDLVVFVVVWTVVWVVVWISGSIAEQCQVAFREWSNQSHVPVWVHLKRAPYRCRSRMASDESFLAVVVVVVVVVVTYAAAIPIPRVRSSLKVGKIAGPEQRMQKIPHLTILEQKKNK